MAKEARVGRRGLGGVPVMRAAHGWASVVDRTAVGGRARSLGTFRPFGRSAMSARVTERFGWGRGARGAYRSVRSRVGRVWERGMGSCEVGERSVTRVESGESLYGRDLFKDLALLGRIISHISNLGVGSYLERRRHAARHSAQRLYRHATLCDGGQRAENRGESDLQTGRELLFRLSLAGSTIGIPK